MFKLETRQSFELVQQLTENNVSFSLDWRGKWRAGATQQTKDHARDLNPERFQGALRVRRSGRNTLNSKVQVAVDVHALSRVLACIRQMSPPALPPGQVELFLPPTRAICQPLWGKPRAEREECLSTSSPARGRCAAKRSFPLTLLARSLVQEDMTSRRGPNE